MIARTSLGVVLLLAALMPTGAEFDSRFDGESAVVQGSIESYRGGSGGSTSSPGSSGASGGSGVLVVPVMVCSRVDTVVMGTAELSQCVRSDGVGSGPPLSSIVEPLVDRGCQMVCVSGRSDLKEIDYDHDEEREAVE